MMNNSTNINLQVITKDRKMFSGAIKSAQFPGIDGLFGVLHNHAPMIFVLKKGSIKIKKEDKKEDFIKIEGGIMEVFKNEIVVLAD
jgi:F-type H+-transporting ATPase subunit epsilon